MVSAPTYMPHPRFPARPHRGTSAGFAARTALGLTIASLLAVRAHALTIVPVWGSSITNDLNAAEIEADINSVINTYYDANFSNNVTISVTIGEDGTVNGAYNNPIYASTKTYAQTIAALQAHASTLDNVAILSKVSPLGNNPLTGTNTGFRMEVALATALGLNGSATSVTSGSITLGLTAGATVNTAIERPVLRQHERHGHAGQPDPCPEWRHGDRCEPRHADDQRGRHFQF